MAIAARDLEKSYPHGKDKRAALRGVSLHVADGETLVVLGPSGAGKTTLLRILAGLEKADAGSATTDGRAALISDRDALFPHMSVASNLRFLAKCSSEQVSSMAARLGIAEHLQKKPAALSAGERRRAALGRALLNRPRALLLDEPFAHLDPRLRVQLRRVFAEFAHGFDGATIHVTHDHTEALAAGDRLAIMIEGEIVQSGAPQTVYDFPATLDVARFLGSPQMNLLGDGMETIGIRPEHICIQEEGPFRGRVRAIETGGADAYVHLLTDRGELIARTSPHSLPNVGQELAFSLPERFVRRFDASGALRR